MPILLFTVFLLLFDFASFHLCTSPLMLSGSVTIPRLQKTGGMTDTTLEETCYLSISCFQDTVQYQHHTGSAPRGRLSQTCLTLCSLSVQPLNQPPL